MTGRSDETRSEDEIRADLALCRSQPLHRVVGGVYRGAVATADALVCLLDDVPALLADRARLEQENERLRLAVEEHDDMRLARYSASERDAARAEITRLRQAVEALCEDDASTQYGYVRLGDLRAALAAALSGSPDEQVVRPVIGPQNSPTPETKHDIVRFYFADADPVAECGCGWRGFGDAPVDAFRAWWAHSAERERAALSGSQEDERRSDV